MDIQSRYAYNFPMEFVSENLNETAEAAKLFLAEIKQASRGATVVGLSGDLGSGKTAFVKCAAEILGVKDPITSPTFVIMKTYGLHHITPKEKIFPTGQAYNKIIHIDAYRLKSSEELNRLNFQEILHNPKNLIFIEWPENVADAIPKNSYKISFEFIDDQTRKINF